MSVEETSVSVDLVSCIVCREETNAIPPEAPTPNCTHRPEVCIECLQKTVKGALERNVMVLCPSVCCRREFTYQELKKWAINEVFAQHERGVLRRTLSDNPQFINCINPTCESGQLHPDGDRAPIVKCHHCGTQQCFRHNVPWHTDQTCEQFDRDGGRTLFYHLREDVKSKWYMKKRVKRCPECRRPVSVLMLRGPMAKILDYQRGGMRSRRMSLWMQILLSLRSVHAYRLCVWESQAQA